MKLIKIIFILFPLITFSQFVNKTTADGLIHNNTTCFMKGLNGDIWIGTEQGISKCNNGVYMGYNTSNGIISTYINDIEMDAYGKIWIGTGAGISVYDGVSWQSYQTGTATTNNIKDVLIADNNDVWIATFNGIWIYNGFTFYNYSTSDGLPSNIIHGLSKDENGVIWIATNAGLCRFNNPGFTVYDYSSGMSANTVKAVYATPDTIYAYCNGGLNIFDGSNFTIFEEVIPTAFSSIRNITLDNNGALWLGFNNGITKFRNSQVEQIFTEINTNLPNSNLGKIYWADSVLYVSTSQNGYYFTDDVESTITFNLSNTDTLDINNIHAIVNSDGILFSRGQSNLFEVPAGSNKQSNYASSIWFGGMDQDNIFHMAGGKFSGQTDWVTGPVASDYNTVEYSVKYHRVWKINKSDIDNHILQWNTGGYNMPEVIQNWPDIYDYFDFNSNGIYDPENGDYPLIRGDQAILSIFNDDLGNFTDNRVKMLVEVHALTYAYNSVDSALNNTIFTNYRILNKSNNNYTSVYFGVYDDIDIGGAADDYMGSDTALNSYYIYNADNTDIEYGTGNIPAQSVSFLSSKMTSATYFTNNSSAETSDPIIPEDYYNYLLGYWKNGSPMTFGGSGYGGTIPVKYVFTGDPTVPTGWNENDAGNTPGDRRGVGVIGSFDLAAGQQICVDVAYVNAIKYNYTNIHSIKELKGRIGEVRSWYYSQNFLCDSIVTLPDTNFTIFAKDTSSCDYSSGSSINFETYKFNGEYPFTYQWADETGTFSSSSASPTVAQPAVTTDYYVTITDNSGLTATDTLTFYIYPTPSINLDNDTLFCVGDTLHIQLPSYDNYHWNTGINTDNITIFEQGDYSVTVTTNGCSASDDIFVTVDVPNINFTEITPACIGIAQELNVDTNFISILWNTGETTPSISVNTSIPGQTYYYVSVTDSFGCSNNDSTIVTVNYPMTLDLGNDTTIDENNFVIISPYVNPGTSFFWSDSSTISYYSINGNNVGTGVFDIWLEITDINGCVNSDSITVTIVPALSINENENNFIINIYPNPSNGTFSVSLLDTKTYKYRIINVNGQIIKTGSLNAGKSKININTQDKGIYFLIIDELKTNKPFVIR